MFFFKKQIFSSIQNNLNEFISPYIDAITTKDISTADLTSFIDEKSIEIVHDVFNKMLNTPPCELKIVGLKEPGQKSLIINRPLNMDDIGRKVPVILRNMRSYARVDPIYDESNYQSTDRKMIGFQLKISGLNPREMQILDRYGFGDSKFKLPGFDNEIIYQVFYKKNLFIPHDHLQQTSADIAPLALGANFKINFTDKIIISPLEARLDNLETKTIDDGRQEIEATVKILTKLTSEQIRHLKSHSILQSNVLVSHAQMPKRATYAKVVYRVTHQEKAGTEKEETIGYFQKPPTEPQSTSKFKKTIADQLWSTVNIDTLIQEMEMNILAGRAPHFRPGPETAENALVGHVILKLDYQWKSTEIAQKIANECTGNLLLINLTREGEYEAFGDKTILNRSLNWWIVGERKGQFVGGYSATNLAEVITALTSSLQEELQLNHQPNPANISVVSDNIDNTEEFNSVLILSLREQGISARIPNEVTEPLIEKGLRVFALLEALKSKQLSFNHLNANQWKDLTSFFQSMKGTLDTKKLLLHITDPEILNRFGAHILSLEGIDFPFSFKGSQALDALERRFEVQRNVSLALREWSAIYGGSFKMLPQNFYIPEIPGAQLNARALIWAYYHASQMGENARLKFFTLLKARAALQQQRHRGLIDSSGLRGLEEFDLRFHHLKLTQANVNRPALDYSFTSLIEPGDYLLYSKTGGSLMVSVKDSVKQWHYTLYDPNIGELKISVNKNPAASRILGQVLEKYFNQKINPLNQNAPTIGEYYGFRKENNRYHISILPLQPALTEVSDTASELQIALRAFHALSLSSDPQQVVDKPKSLPITVSAEIKHPLSSSVNPEPTTSKPETTGSPVKKTKPNTVSRNASQKIKQEKLRQIDQRMGTTFKVMKIGSTIDFMIDYIKYFVLFGKKKEKSQEESQLTKYQNMQAINLTVNFVVDGMQYTFYHRMKEMQKGSNISRTLMSAATKIKLQGNAVPKGIQMSAQASKMRGLIVGAFAVNTLNFIGVVFDIYFTYDCFNQASTEKNADKKTDLMVQGGFQSIQLASGVVVAISTLGAVFMPKMSVAGMLLSAWTLGLSISMALAAKVYSSISMVNLISKEIRLSTAEKVREGLYISLMNHPTPETQNRLTEKKTREILKEKFDIQVAEKAHKTFNLLQNIHASDYFYVTSDFILQEKHYIELTYFTNNHTKGRVPPSFESFFNGKQNIYDHSNLPGYFHPEEVEERKHIYTKMINEMKPNPGKGTLVTHYQENESPYCYYDFVRFTESDDVVNANELSENSSLVEQLERASFPNWPLITEPAHSNDLNGSDQNDVLILPKNQLGSISAHAGDDILTLQNGLAMGGIGTDTYCIVRSVLKRPYINPDVVDRFTVDIIDQPGEFSYIMLNYDFNELKKMELLREGDSFYLVLSMDNQNNSETVIKIKDVYRLDTKNEALLVLSNRFTLITDDGLLLAPRFPAFIKTPLEQGNIPFHLKFDAIYSVDYDQASHQPALIDPVNKTLTKTIKNRTKVIQLSDDIHFIKDQPIGRSELCASFSAFLKPKEDSSAVFDLGGGNDKATGYLNKKNHFFPGTGNKQYQGGHFADIFNLESGQATGSKGRDTFNILNHSQPKDAKVIIVEESNECSDIYLHYTLRDIESIRLDERGNEYDLNILLKNANTTYTTLILRSLYRQDSQESAALILDKNAIFYTQDGALMTPQWPDKLEQKEEFEGIFNVQYHYLHDLNHQDYFEKTPPDQVNILFKTGSGQSPDIIKVGENEIVLTKEQNLILSDTPFNDKMEGNEEANIFFSYRGADFLIGNPGQDVYEIGLDDRKIPRTVVIDNQDDQSKPEIDEIILPMNIDQMTQPIRKGDDIILRSRLEYDSQKALEIVLIDFMKGEKYRHIKIRDASNGVYDIDVDDFDEPYIGQPKAKVIPSESSDVILITDAENLPHLFFAQAGDDVVVDKSRAARHIKGGLGDDALINHSLTGKTLDGEQGKNELHGHDGDDMFQLGRGIDHANGGKGDDFYDYTYRDGDAEFPADDQVKAIIQDKEGENTLTLNQVTLENIQYQWKNEGKDLHLFISKKANREKQDEIILQDVSESIAKVMLGEHSMNIEQLIQSISAVIPQDPEAQGTDRFVPDFASENPMLSGQWVHF